jgi:hypothetical protein
MAWYGEQAKKRMRLAAASTIKRAANILVEAHQKDLNRRYPPASKVREFPAKRTGRLRQSVVTAPLTVTEIASKQYALVFYDMTAPYIRKLLRSGRFGLRMTLERVRPKLKALGVKAT